MVDNVQLVSDAEALTRNGLLARRLATGDWMVGRSADVDSLEKDADHYDNPNVTIATTLREAIDNWEAQHAVRSRESSCWPGIRRMDR